MWPRTRKHRANSRLRTGLCTAGRCTRRPSDEIRTRHAQARAATPCRTGPDGRPATLRPPRARRRRRARGARAPPRPLAARGRRAARLTRPDRARPGGDRRALRPPRPPPASAARRGAPAATAASAARRPRGRGARRGGVGEPRRRPRLLRGPAIREHAVTLLLESGRDALHYRRWFELLTDERLRDRGQGPAGRFPDADHALAGRPQGRRAGRLRARPPRARAAANTPCNGCSATSRAPSPIAPAARGSRPRSAAPSGRSRRPRAPSTRVEARRRHRLSHH